MSKEAAPIAQEYIVGEDIEARLDAREVYNANGERYGYVLFDVGTGHVSLTLVRDCRHCAWADAESLVYATGSRALEYHPWSVWRRNHNHADTASIGEAFKAARPDQPAGWPTVPVGRGCAPSIQKESLTNRLFQGFDQNEGRKSYDTTEDPRRTEAVRQHRG